jgi:hypothetical protein
MTDIAAGQSAVCSLDPGPCKSFLGQADFLGHGAWLNRNEQLSGSWDTRIFNAEVEWEVALPLNMLPLCCHSLMSGSCMCTVGMTSVVLSASGNPSPCAYPQTLSVTGRHALCLRVAAVCCTASQQVTTSPPPPRPPTDTHLHRFTHLCFDFGLQQCAAQPAWL